VASSQAAKIALSAFSISSPVRPKPFLLENSLPKIQNGKLKILAECMGKVGILSTLKLSCRKFSAFGQKAATSCF